ncbi:hypothetical protein [Shimia thalassica]|uniref:hypothetical protein n=1 Tax=Shimia thalassica TaxID=1715693 RepID=UPI002735BFEF|nr:hypothetical protein [Shimia thalassica]MDP2517167.1 hypothetical protein [Shimia thalassica]
MSILRGILAITLIAMLLIGNLIESQVHAAVPDCVGEHCHDHMSANDMSSDLSLSKHVHSGSDSDQTTHECCDQIFCQTASLAECPTLVRPLGHQSVSWAQNGQLAAVNRPQTLERPPNS